MGEVYAATDVNLARQVAIKVLPDAWRLMPIASRVSTAKPGRWPR